MKVAKKVFFIALMIWIVSTASVYASTATVKASAVVLREGPSTSTEPLAEIKNGKTVEIIEKTDNWYKVEYNGKTGYVREDLLNVVEEVVTEVKEEVEEPKTEEPAKEEQQEEVKEEETKKEEQQEEVEKKTEKEENVINTLGEKIVKSSTITKIVPNVSASTLGDLKEGTKVTVIKVLNLWSCIKFENGKTAWVLTSFLTDANTEGEEETEGPEVPAEFEPKTGYINVSAAVIRTGPSTSADIVTEKYRNNAIEIIGEDGDWYKISIDYQEAYVAKRLISDSVTTESTSRNLAERTLQEALEQDLAAAQELVKQEEEKQEEAKAEESKPEIQATPAPATPAPVVEEPAAAPASSSRGSEVVAVANKYLGCSYTYGGSGPSTFDCSGFTMYVYSQFGVSLAHGAISQSNAGTYVPRDQLEPGDLVIFRDWDNTSIGHCGIYIGGGRFIHAANPNRGVVTDTLNSGYYYERYVTARRLV